MRHILLLSLVLIVSFTSNAFAPDSPQWRPMLPQDPSRHDFGLVTSFSSFQDPLDKYIRNKRVGWENKDFYYLSRQERVSAKEAMDVLDERQPIWEGSNKQDIITAYYATDRFGQIMKLPEKNSIGLIYKRRGDRLGTFKILHITDIDEPEILQEIVRGFRPLTK